MTQKILIIPYQRRGKGKPTFLVRNTYGKTLSSRTPRVNGYQLLTFSSTVDAYKTLHRLGIKDATLKHKETIYDVDSSSRITILILQCKCKRYDLTEFSWVNIVDLFKKNTASKSILSRIHLFSKSPVCLRTDS